MMSVESNKTAIVTVAYYNTQTNHTKREFEAFIGIACGAEVFVVFCVCNSERVPPILEAVPAIATEDIIEESNSSCDTEYK